METRYALFISITANFFSLFNINNTILSPFFFFLFFFSLSFFSTHTHTRIASGYISGSLSHIYSHYRRCFVQICLLEILQASSAENIESDEYFMICRAFPALQPCGAITIIYKSIDWRKKGGGRGGGGISIIIFKYK